MTVWAEVLWSVMGLGLMVYAITGGADLGAGIWSLLATGPRKEEQRKAILHAIGPIWEANHVWLIFVIVVMFSAFSPAFSAISIALHIPIGLALIGIVFRGASYVFHAYGIQDERSRLHWTEVFSWSSALTPVLLGMVVGALSTGDIRWRDGHVSTGFLAGWTSGFALLVGWLAAALFALLSAVYLTVDSYGALREDFRKRALVAEAVAFLIAAAAFIAARTQAPLLFQRLIDSAWTWPLQVATALCAFVTMALLYRRNYRWVRFTAAAQVSLVVIGWGAAMHPHFILPDLSLRAATPHPELLPYIALALGAGSLLLGPALWYLYRVFKRV